jgi:hypothetical protein
MPEDRKKKPQKKDPASRWFLAVATVVVAGLLIPSLLYRGQPAFKPIEVADLDPAKTPLPESEKEISLYRSNDEPFDKQDDFSALSQEGLGSLASPAEPAAADENNGRRKDQAELFFEARQRKREEFPSLLWDQEEQNKPSSRLKSGEVDRLVVGGKALPSETTPFDDDIVSTFLTERSRIDGLLFKEATGYWANTYLPGDPTMRFLDARLRSYDPRVLEAYVGRRLDLHTQVRRVAQPFDAPVSSSLTVYLQADRKSLADKGRLLVQVGIKGIERQAGRRPAMNVGVVLDLRGEISIDVAKSMRALLTELLRAKELGDRMRLIVAGRPGGLVLESKNFRYGPLAVALDRLLTNEEPFDGENFSLEQAMVAAIRDVTNDDDPTATLGSSTILLVTSQPIGAKKDRLVSLSHKSAVAGIPVSVLGVGGEVDADELEQIALAGQGSRRLLERASEAVAIIDEELASASRVIARAVRLRIRLAEGVQLVDVLGSERLDEARAQRVRDAEQSIDSRLARNLGIEADRGDDEDGIQIVIPNYYSGDEHVFLLDVVAPGAGPIADVTVRYKDLAFVRNAVARASLAVKRGEAPAGALEWNVLGNLFALKLADALEKAGEALSIGDVQQASRLLTSHRDLLRGLQAELAGLDADDTRDTLNLINEYIALMETTAIQQHALRCFLADSLRYASWLKQQPPMGS